MAQDAGHAVRDRPSLGGLQGPLQHPLYQPAPGHGTQFQPVYGDHPAHQSERNRCVQPGISEPAAPHHRKRLGHGKAGEDHLHRHAHAGQRHRVQLLLRAPGTQLQPAPPPRGPGDNGFPGCPVQAAPALLRR